MADVDTVYNDSSLAFRRSDGHNATGLTGPMQATRFEVEAGDIGAATEQYFGTTAAGNGCINVPVGKAIRFQAAGLNVGAAGLAVITTAGGTTTYTSTADVALVSGSRVLVKANASNTGASTINFNSGGAKNIFKLGAALSANDFLINTVYELVYDGTQFHLL